MVIKSCKPLRLPITLYNETSTWCYFKPGDWKLDNCGRPIHQLELSKHFIGLPVFGITYFLLAPEILTTLSVHFSVCESYHHNYVWIVGTHWLKISKQTSTFNSKIREKQINIYSNPDTTHNMATNCQKITQLFLSLFHVFPFPIDILTSMKILGMPKLRLLVMRVYQTSSNNMYNSIGSPLSPTLARLAPYLVFRVL